MLTKCDTKEEYYAPPKTLAPPIYQQLEARGNFTHFLACVDKAGYKQSLSSSGYWTIFAPTDEAFTKYFAANGLAGIGAIDEAKAREIVTYSLVYNAFSKEKLAEFQSSIGWVPGQSFKRRTAYYSAPYKSNIGGQEAFVVANNRNGLNYVTEDNNNKYLPYFIDSYFAAQGLSEVDYKTFYPNTPYTGFNVADAAVTGSDHSIRAENGMIHIIDKVLLPLPSIDEYLATKPEYSVFKGLLEKYAASYVSSAAATEKWNKRGVSGSVYLKTFPNVLAFNPGNENFLKQMDNDGQSDSWSMFVPTNEVLTKYINEVLLEHYNSLDEIGTQVIYDFINAHMWQTAVWPSKFSTTTNFVGEVARFNRVTDVVDPKVLSNGMFYGASKVQESDAFHSIFGKVYLDPKFSLMSRFLQRELRSAVSNPNVRFTMFLLSDDVLNEAGFTYDNINNTWFYKGSTSGVISPINRLDRLINSHIAITMRGELDNLGSEGIYDTYGGELIKFKNNVVYAAGNLEPDPQQALNSNDLPRVIGKKEATNGIVYYLDKPLLSAETAIGLHMQKYPQFSRFFTYLDNSSIYNKTTGEILGTASGTFYTYFIPSDAAIEKAIADGVLPADPATTVAAEKEKINSFILYHILNRFSTIADGKEDGLRLESVYKTITGDVTVLHITSKQEAKLLQVTDMKGRTATVQNEFSNIIANRSVMHLIDNYLQYVE
ncbi:fasciclin domain-containing protein [Pontibacter beigongshangensis]|uniref:fasciclin domain-containing protein n=1 Tax=Pontibacter beigongshangensis TaxID=2574733 RepID=UPI00165009B5|nr:fasciclin domain-containing protein [Pontibacter beigongshangensis]